MACCSRTRTTYGPSRFHPYAAALQVKRSKQPLQQPLFSDIQCEILQDAPGEPSPSWLIRETGEAYAFLVEQQYSAGQDCLSAEEIEVQLERWDISQAADGSAAASSSHQTFYSGRSGALGNARTLLTILCCRRFDTSNADALDDGCTAVEAECCSGYIKAWKFVRRFSLPYDAQPEEATAAHESGSLTVLVPRRRSYRSPWSKEPVLPGSWRTTTGVDNLRPQACVSGCQTERLFGCNHRSRGDVDVESGVKASSHFPEWRRKVQESWRRTWSEKGEDSGKVYSDEAFQRLKPRELEIRWKNCVPGGCSRSVRSTGQEGITYCASLQGCGVRESAQHRGEVMDVEMMEC